jgi:hypothetical protein
LRSAARARAARGVDSLIVGLLGGSRDDRDEADDLLEARVLRVAGEDMISVYVYGCMAVWWWEVGGKMAMVVVENGGQRLEVFGERESKSSFFGGDALRDATTR